MKTNIILLLTIFFFIKSYSQQIFPMPSGQSGELDNKTKDVSYSNFVNWPFCQSLQITTMKVKKESSENRRFRFTARRY